MIDFKSVTMRNFLSFGNKPTTIALDGKETVLIVGDNRDVGEEGTSGNGSGKSSGIQAIVYALYGKGFDPSLKQDAMVNVVNESEMTVELDFSVNNVPCKIRRGRKPNVLNLIIDGEDVTRDSLKNTDEAIEELIGISYDMFVMTIVMSTSVVPFMARKPAEQRKFMEDSLGLTLLTERSTAIKEMKKELEVDIKLSEKDLENAASTNEFIQKQIDKAIEDKRSFDQQCAEIISENSSYLQSDVVKSFDIDTILPLLRRYEGSSDSLKELEVSINRTETELQNARRTLTSFNANLENLQFSVEQSKNAIEKGTVRRAELVEKIDKLKPEIEELEVLLGRLTAKKEAVAAVDEMEKQLEYLEDYLDKEEAKIQQFEKELSHLMDEKCPFCLQKYSDEEANQKIIDTKKTINEMKSACQVVMDDLERLGEDAEKVLESSEYNDPITEENVSEGLVGDLKKMLFSHENELERIDTEINNLKIINDPEVLDEKIKDAKAEIVRAKTLVEEVEQRSASLLHDREEIIKSFEKQKEWQQTLAEEYNTVALAESYEDELKQIMSEIEDAKQKKNPYDGKAEELMEELLDIDEFKQKITDLEKEKKHCDYLVKLLTNNKSFIRKGIVDQYVGFLNRKINQYADSVGLTHVIEVNSDLSVEIEYMNRPVGYSNMSAGERLRLDISTAMALRDMLGMLGMKANLTVVDEFLDSATDSSGARKIFNMLKGYSDKVMIISHRPDYDTLVDRKMTVIKQGGFTRIE